MSIAMQPAGTDESSLLRKAEGLGLSLPLDLERLAILRGCDYYDRELPVRNSPLGEVAMSNGELAIALIIPALRPTAREIRLAAALLGAPGVSADEVAALAASERCEEIVGHIAFCGRRFEPENPFWQTLLVRLPAGQSGGVHLPHPTRFVEMTGIDRGKVGMATRWIRPRQPVAA